MAYCEMCGTQIPDGQTRCENCSPHKEKPVFASAPAPQIKATARTAEFPFARYLDLVKEVPKKFKSFSFSNINWVGMGSLLFLFFAMILPVLRGTWLWELGGIYYFGFDGALIPIAVILVFLLSPICYLLRLDKIAFVLAIINLTAFLIVFIPNRIGTFHVGIIMWLFSVILQLSANLVTRVLDYYVFKK